MIKKNILPLIIVLFIFLSLGRASLFSHSSEKNGVILTWKDLQELLDLNTDKIKVSLEEFRRLMKQTGVNIDMGMEIKDGVVTLRRDQFRRLVGKMKPVDKRKPKPPTDYLITGAKYTGVADQKNTRFTAFFKVYVFEQNKTGYINIPVVHSSLAVKDIQVNGTPAVILNSGNWHNVSLKEDGYHEVKVAFSVGNHKQKIFLPIVRSATTQIDFSVLNRGIDIHVNPSVNKRVINREDRTQIRVNAMPTDNLEFGWVRRAEKRSQQPALFYAHTRSLISVDENILRVNTRVTLEVIKSTLDRVSLLVPLNYEIIKVDGISESQWGVRETGIGRILELHFRYDVDSNVGFTIHAERMLPSDMLVADFNGFKVMEARRETGDIGVVAESTVQVNIEEYQKESQGLEKIKYHKLPKGFLTMSSRPILSAYKYVKHPYRLLVRITKHNRMEGMTTVIKSAEITSLFLKEGKMICRVIYTVHNTFKQFMELELPKNADIWTVYVDQKRGKASLNEKGKVLIPLLRSFGNGEHIKPFTIELVYAISSGRFGLSGEGECLIPSCDIFINKMKVEMYMPEDFNYTFNKDGWKEETAVINGQTSDPFIDGTASLEEISREGEPRDKDSLSQVPISEKPVEVKEQIVVPGKIDSIDNRKRNDQYITKNQSVLKRSQSKGVTAPVGLRSINIHLPLSGDCFIFSKKIIDKDEPFSLNFFYYENRLKQVIFYLVFGLLLIGFSLVIKYRFKKSKPA